MELKHESSSLEVKIEAEADADGRHSVCVVFRGKGLSKSKLGIALAGLSGIGSLAYWAFSVFGG